MARKIAVILTAVLLASLVLTLCGCATEDYNNYPVVTATPSANDAVSSNGGNAVEKGDYIYFINGAGAYTAANAYGKVRDGAIMIISKADLATAYAKGNQAEVSDYLYTKAEVIVPKIVIQGATTDKTIQGFYIFGDRIYFFTPNTELGKDALPKNTEMCLKSCTLNGRDVQHHYTFASRTIVTFLTQNNGKVFCTFIEDSKVYNMTVEGDKNEAKEVVASTASVVFDQPNNVMYYVNSDSTTIGKYIPGEDNGTDLVYGKKGADGNLLPVNKHCTYTLINASNNLCYYKATSAANASLTGVYKLTANSTTPELITNYSPNSLLISGNYLYTVNTVSSSSSSTSSTVVVYDLTTQDIAHTKVYSSSATVMFANNNVLHFAVGSTLHKLTAPQDFTEYMQPQEDNTVKTLSTEIIATKGVYGDYCTYDFCGDYVFLFASSQDSANAVYPIYAVHKDDAVASSENATTYTVEGFDISCPTKRYYSVSTLAGLTNGTLTYKQGTTVVKRATEGTVITITTAPSTNYELVADSITVNGGSVDVTNTDGVYTFIMPAGHVTVDADFSPKQFTISASSTITNGRIQITNASGNAITSAKMGDIIHVTYTANDGYKLTPSSLKFNTTTIFTVVDDDTMSFSMPASTVTINATFEAISSDE